jgi:putative ABC transport system ATP-binding protein
MSEPMMKLTDVSKYFAKGSETIRAVDGVSFSVQRGDFVTIQGASGSGKSTLLHLLGGLDWPTRGQVTFNGQEISRMGDQALSQLRLRHIGFIFQSFNLIADLDVLQNVALPLKYAGVSKPEREQRARSMLAMVGMEHRLGHYPGELSGGEEQRVAVARALVNQPDLVLADEPTGNLDTSNRDSLLELFASLHKQGQTFVIVTHDRAVAEKAAQQYWMQNGKLFGIK